MKKFNLRGFVTKSTWPTCSLMTRSFSLHPSISLHLNVSPIKWLLAKLKLWCRSAPQGPCQTLVLVGCHREFVMPIRLLPKCQHPSMNALKNKQKHRENNEFITYFIHLSYRCCIQSITKISSKIAEHTHFFFQICINLLRKHWSFYSPHHLGCRSAQIQNICS